MAGETLHGAHRWRRPRQRNLGGADLRAGVRPGDPPALDLGGEPRLAAADRPSEVGRRVCMRFRDVLAHQ